MNATRSARAAGAGNHVSIPPRPGPGVRCRPERIGSINSGCPAGWTD